VPRAAAAQLERVGRERQVHGEALHPVALHQHGAVVARRVGVEEREQERLRQAPVELDPAGHVAVERLAARQHDQRAHPLARHLADGAHDRIHHVGRWSQRLAAQAPHGELLEPAAQVVLEHHHQDQHADREDALEQPGRHLELELARHQVEAHGDRHTGHGDARAGAPDPAQTRPQQHGDDQDVDQVREADVGHDELAAGGSVSRV
jgi:hypothetical protein